MVKHLKIADGKIVEADPGNGQVLVFAAPDEAERKALVEQHHVDEHTLTSCLDPDELSRLECEEDHVALILKRPKRYSSEDNFLFKVASVGAFLFKERLIIVVDEDAPLFEGKPFSRVRSLQDIILRLLYRSIHHFEGHLKVMNMIAAELEREINTAMENKHLLHLFTLEKSLTYYLNAISSNARLIDKLKVNAPKVGFVAEHVEYLDDITIENSQCYEQAQIYSTILASLMDARASIVANNLNVLMKKLNIIMVALMLPTLVVSIFSMNVRLPVPGPDGSPVWPFWMVLGLATASSVVVLFIWKKRM